MSADDNDFDVAKKVTNLLQGVAKERQQKILRWVAENFDLAMTNPTPGQGPSNPAQGGTPGGMAGQQGRALDVKTFIDSKNPGSDVQFATAIAYYYRFEAPAEQRKDSITAETLQDATRLAGRTRITQPRVVLHNAKKQGYLDSADRGQFRINTVGENLIAMALPSSGKAASSTRKSRAGRPTAKKPQATRGRKVTARTKRP
ncbi:MAG: hypothetical protein ACHQ0J_04970 [Candidatus Dormibacterales bacterium]